MIDDLLLDCQMTVDSYCGLDGLLIRPDRRHIRFLYIFIDHAVDAEDSIPSLEAWEDCNYGGTPWI